VSTSKIRTQKKISVDIIFLKIVVKFCHISAYQLFRCLALGVFGELLNRHAILPFLRLLLPTDLCPRNQIKGAGWKEEPWMYLLPLNRSLHYTSVVWLCPRHIFLHTNIDLFDWDIIIIVKNLYLLFDNVKYPFSVSQRTMLIDRFNI
jgi:hypothetical protein